MEPHKTMCLALLSSDLIHQRQWQNNQVFPAELIQPNLFLQPLPIINFLGQYVWLLKGMSAQDLLILTPWELSELYLK